MITTILASCDVIGLLKFVFGLIFAAFVLFLFFGS